MRISKMKPMDFDSYAGVANDGNALIARKKISIKKYLEFLSEVALKTGRRGYLVEDNKYQEIYDLYEGVITLVYGNSIDEPELGAHVSMDFMGIWFIFDSGFSLEDIIEDVERALGNDDFSSLFYTAVDVIVEG